MRQLSSLFQAPLSGDFEGLGVEGAGRFLSGRLLPLVRVLCRGPSLPPCVSTCRLRSAGAEQPQGWPEAALAGGVGTGSGRKGEESPA